MLPSLVHRSFFPLSIALLLTQSGQSGPADRTDYASFARFSSSGAPLDQLTQAYKRKEYPESIQIAQGLLRDPETRSRPGLNLRISRILGAAQVAIGRNRDALNTLLPARQLALQRGDFQSLVSLDNNIAWIYVKMENLASAAEFADQALAAMRSQKIYDVRIVFLRALVYAKVREFRQSDPLFSEAINHSLDANNLDYAAMSWYYQGRGYSIAGRNAEAEFALTESFRLRKLHHLPDLEVSMRDLAEVLANRGELRTSTVLLDEAVSLMGNPKSTADVWGFLLDRGRLRMMKGDLPGALLDLRASLQIARHLDVVPADDDRITFESGLADLYSLFVDCGNQIYVQSHDPALKAEIFEAAEENRAASLRALVPQPNGWRTHLAAEHGPVLERLQDAERKLLLHEDKVQELKVRELQVSLDQIESRAQPPEQLPGLSALQSAKNALDSDTAILSFHLGSKTSWVWAITRKTFEVYRLRENTELTETVSEFRKAVSSGNENSALADSLGEILLAPLPSEVHHKHKWIVALDRELFDLPLSALRWKGRYLIEDHALLLTPGVCLLKPVGTAPAFKGKLVAIGDPIYNRADPRWSTPAHARGWADVHLRPFADDAGDSWHLARLTGSGHEARSALAHWGSGTILTDAEATKLNFLRISQEQPTILHLATHVVREGRDQRAGTVVFGLNSKGIPEFLGMREILQQSLHVQLVVMSGCASGDGQALPASGLMGLTRAWLGSGVDEVLATRWPSLDDSGPFFSSFYGNLRQNPSKGAAAALQKAKLEMLHSHSFRANPSYWASYFLIGKI